MMKARVKYPTEDKKNAGKKTVMGAGLLSNGEIKCNGNATEPPKVDNCQSLDQSNLQTERNARQIGESHITHPHNYHNYHMAPCHCHMSL